MLLSFEMRAILDEWHLRDLWELHHCNAQLDDAISIGAIGEYALQNVESDAWSVESDLVRSSSP